MKAKALIMVLCIAGTTASAQEKAIRTKPQPAAFAPVTKGYYAIGNNIEKLDATPSGLTVQQTEGETNVRKGYYAIGNNSSKIKKQQVIQDKEASQAPAKRTWPMKGYYGIGNNAEKLK